MIRRDTGLDSLLELDGQIVYQAKGYWVKFEVRLVKTSDERPHGIRYSLTLHDPRGERLMGFDNAHPAPLPKKFKYSGQRLPYDHKHLSISDRGNAYNFVDGYQLLSDFWQEVDRVLRELQVIEGDD